MTLVPDNHWVSQGHIFSSEMNCDWAVSHASVPHAIKIAERHYRVYFSARDALGKSHLGFFEFNPENPEKVLETSAVPAFSPGRLGAFDGDGVYGTSIVECDSCHYCYYGGWVSGADGMFYSSIGLAVSQDGGRCFERVQEYPILGRDKYDHWAVLAPFVRKDTDRWRMWFVSGINIEVSNSGINSEYDLKSAYSEDGINWQKTGSSVIELGAEDSNISRTCIQYYGGYWHAWYSFVRKDLKDYRLGYAISEDGLTFIRRDNEITFQHANDKWNDGVVAYPFVFRVGDNFFMLYNGAANGRVGIGLASCSGVQR